VARTFQTPSIDRPRWTTTEGRPPRVAFPREALLLSTSLALPGTGRVRGTTPGSGGHPDALGLAAFAAREGGVAAAGHPAAGEDGRALAGGRAGLIADEVAAGPTSRARPPGRIRGRSVTPDVTVGRRAQLRSRGSRWTSDLRAVPGPGWSPRAAHQIGPMPRGRAGLSLDRTPDQRSCSAASRNPCSVSRPRAQAHGRPAAWSGPGERPGDPTRC